MPKFVSGSSGHVYARDQAKSKKEEDDILAVISNQSGQQDVESKKPSAINNKGFKEKQRSSLDLFKEELRRLNEARDEQRNRLKQSLTNSSTSQISDATTIQSKPHQIPQPIPLPLKPDPRCPTALTLQVNLNPKDRDAPSLGSFDTGDPTTTNLYVGNLNPIVTENDLCDIFGKFGSLASIKIMWPRTDEERARNRNSGFVAYMSRIDADRALRTLNGMDFKSYEMKLGWGKTVPIPKNPVFIPKELQDLLKPPAWSGLPFNAQLDKSDLDRGYQVPQTLPKAPISSEIASKEYEEFVQVFERSTVHVFMPQDRQILDKIHKTIEFCLREGPVFESIITARESKNPQYTFLYDHNSIEHTYYRWRLYSLLHGEDPHNWRQERFKMFVGGPWWKPPPMNPFADGMPIELVEKLTGINRDILKSGRSVGDLSKKMEIFCSQPTTSGSSELRFKGKFDDSKSRILDDMIAKLLPTKTSVGTTMLFCIDHSESAEVIIDHIEKAFNSFNESSATLIALLFLISDILQNSSAAVTNASYYRKGFQSILINIFQIIRDHAQSIENSFKVEQFNKRVMSVLSSWSYFQIYESKYLLQLSNVLMGNQVSDQGVVVETCSSSETLNQDKLSETVQIDEQLDGEQIEESVLAECLEVRGLSLRWYKTLELSDDEEEAIVVNIDEGARGGSVGEASQLLPRPTDNKPLEDKVKFKASKWEVVDHEKIEPQSSSALLKPIRTISTQELLRQQQLKQDMKSDDEYESLASSDESHM